MLGVNRSTVWRHKTGHSSAVIDLEKVRREARLTERIHELVEEQPSWGYRRIWAWPRFWDGVVINCKKMRRIMKKNGWQARTIVRTPRPRLASKRSPLTTLNAWGRYGTDFGT